VCVCVCSKVVPVTDPGTNKTVLNALTKVTYRTHHTQNVCYVLNLLIVAQSLAQAQGLAAQSLNNAGRTMCLLGDGTHFVYRTQLSKFQQHKKIKKKPNEMTIKNAAIYVTYVE